MRTEITTIDRRATANIGLAIWRLKCFYETFVLKNRHIAKPRSVVSQCSASLRNAKQRFGGLHPQLHAVQSASFFRTSHCVQLRICEIRKNNFAHSIIFPNFANPPKR